MIWQNQQFSSVLRVGDPVKGPRAMNTNLMDKKAYSLWFMLPLGIIYVILFLLPTVLSFFFSLTIWSWNGWRFVGLDNFVTFFTDYSLSISLINTLIYSGSVCLFKVTLGLLLGVILSGKLRGRNFITAFIFFPNLLSSIAIGLAFKALLHPTRGLINLGLAIAGINGPDWLGNSSTALLAVILVDLWKGIGITTVIYLAGINAISPNYYEAASIDGANGFRSFFHITLPLCRPSMNTIIILSLINGMRTFDLVWAMTKGGPGYASDVLASVIYKEYVTGFYGLSTAGNVVMLVLISVIALPLFRYLTSKEIYI
jgi:raffinose/stachyose/melibiose transport system permease protein